jgi:small nuclear ribonucleoprotein (snRNP)-like protein
MRAFILQGNLVSWDQRSNIILSECVERRFSMDSGAVDSPLGVYLVKGDQM